VYAEGFVVGWVKVVSLEVERTFAATVGSDGDFFSLGKQLLQNNVPVKAYKGGALQIELRD